MRRDPPSSEVRYDFRAGHVQYVDFRLANTEFILKRGGEGEM
jgi:hypothetical protein